ncbi:MAG: FtsX-like permease family protein [Cyanobium sp. MAG06]|nr:FtsX-like permease family protein [Cyanobium sp. MAG06]
MIIKLSSRIIKREFGKLLLPFVSIIISSIIITTTIFTINAVKDFLLTKNKEYIGGDIVYRDNSTSINIDNLLDKSLIKNISEIINLNVRLNNDDKNSSVNLDIVDNNFPLYGEVLLNNSDYMYLRKGEIYIDNIIANNLAVKVGDNIYIGDSLFVIKDIITSHPETYINLFDIAGKAIISRESMNNLPDLSLFRKSFNIKVKLNNSLNKSDITNLRSVARANNINMNIAADSKNINFALDIVNSFLIVIILIVCVLAIVNIYAISNYLINKLRRDFAILLAIGMKLNNIYKMIISIYTIIFTSAIIIGLMGGYILFYFIANYIYTQSNILLNTIIDYSTVMYIFLTVFAIAIFAIMPTLHILNNISPKDLLNNITKGNNIFSRSILLMISIMPLIFLAMYFLNNIWQSLLIITIILAIYLLFFYLYLWIIRVLYKNRMSMSFFVRSIVNEKKYDGVFGAVAFASLSIGLISIFTLSMSKTSITEYLQKDLTNIPSLYLLDIQSSQIDNILKINNSLETFPIIRARLSYINDKNIRELLDNDNQDINRELQREFNITYKNNLLEGEIVLDGEYPPVGNEVSVERDFAERAGIRMGDIIALNMAGIDINYKVNSIRAVNSRNGKPFFYFIISNDIAKDYPKTYIGVLNQSNISDNSVESNNLSTFLSKNYPNVSIINTQSIVQTAEKLLAVLLLIILIVTIPPLFISTLLIITILTTLSKSRKRDGLRLVILGKTTDYVRNKYIIESLSSSIFSAIICYILAIIISNTIINKYLKIENIIYYDIISIIILLIILFIIILVSVIL